MKIKLFLAIALFCAGFVTMSAPNAHAAYTDDGKTLAKCTSGRCK